MVADEAGSPGGARIRELLAEGAELYNEGAFWEAHEAWEEAWLALREEGHEAPAAYLQGLILATAAFENLSRGKPAGFATQGAKALHRFREHEGHGTELGLADEAGFREALLEVYLTVQRRKLEDLDEVEAELPRLEITT